MTHQNLVLTEKAIKAHCKRLQKELKIYNQDLSLGETQNLFSKSLGFNNFHELKKVLDNNKNINANDININEKLIKFIEYIEHESDFIWILPDGQISYRPYEEKGYTDLKKDSIDLKENHFNKKDFNLLINFLFNQIPNNKEEMNDEILRFPSDEQIYHLSTKTKQYIDEGLIRELNFQIYFDNKKTITAIKILITYKLKGEMVSYFYKDIKHLFLEKNLSLKIIKENKKIEQQKRYFIINTQKYSIESKYLELYNLCIDGNLSKLKEYLDTTKNINLNQPVPDRSWEPQTAIELALAFEHFHVVNYLIDNSKKLNIDIHSSNDYLLRHCCIEGSEEHFKIVKKMFKKTRFQHLPTISVSIDNILTMAYGSNEKLAKYLEEQTYQIGYPPKIYFKK